LRAIALTVPLLAAGCAIPVPLQIASWVADGISYVTTKKSLTDHGISLVMDQDCALWRGFVEGEICHEDATHDTPKGTVQVAAGNDEKAWDIVPAAGPDIDRGPIGDDATDK